MTAATIPGTAGFVATGNYRDGSDDLAVVDSTNNVARVLVNRSLIFASQFEIPGSCPPGTILLGNGTCGVP